MIINSTSAHQDMTLFWSGNYTTVLDTQDPSHSLQTYAERVVVAAFILLIAISNIVGNSLVILAVVFSKKLRTSTNAFVVSLSAADLLAGLAVSMTVVALLNPGESWPSVLCSMAGVVLYVNSTASLFNLASIALNRLILIKRPTLYRSLYTRLTIAVNIAVVWIAAIAVMVVPPLLGIGGFGYDEQHHACSDLDTHPKAKIFEKIQTVLSFPIPFIIIVSSYIMIYMHVRRHFQAQRVLRGISDEAPTTSSGNFIFVVSDNATALRTSHQDRINRQQVEITKNLFIAFCAFFFCVAPYSIALFLPNNDRYLLFLAAVFFCNSCVNPFIYGAKHPQFKKVMRCMLRCQYSQIEEPSDTLKALMNCCRE
ncbi:melatonin receptor type 1B-A-like [Patiria miniata]|uniref:G-protein coupled receptors family 1 profile domain-containing protein n=1 Tax=Patiria miniata TaxID=46514 RepID=A0A914BPN3_PATMI|nr:melatonin receptor type 1B-A-like [Patiria miniata]